MFVRYRTKAIILKASPFLETDKIFVVFTQEFGKLMVLGKGIRKIGAKLKMAMEPLSHTEIEFIQGKTHKTLTDAILLDPFKKIKTALSKIKVGLVIIKTLDLLLPPETKEDRVWTLTLSIFKGLKKIQEKDRKSLFLIYYYFLWKLFAFLGYQPDLYYCVYCQQRFSSPYVYFSFFARGLICHRCFKKEKTKEKMFLELNSAVIKILRLFTEKEWSLVRRIKLKKDWQKKIQKFSLLYLDFILEKVDEKESFLYY